MKRSVWLLSLVAMLCTLALRGTTLLSYAWGSAGLAILGQALTATPETPSSQAAAQAEALLQRSTACAPENRYAWRGLGFALAVQGREDEAIAVWQTTEGMAEEFIERGAHARKAEQYQEALSWYERAARVEPGLRDPWYYMGLTYELMENWERGAEAYREGLQRSAMSRVELGDIYFRLGRIWEQKTPAPDQQTALASYDRALELDAFSNEWVWIQTHYARGELLHKMGKKREAMKEYEWVIAHRPSDYWAHVHLGFLTWKLDQDAAEAEVLLLRALDIDDSNKWVYRGLGLIYQETGRWDEAMEMYRQVLLLDPTDAVANEQLTKMTGGNE